MPEPLTTREQVQNLLAQAFPGRTFSLIEFRFGWVCRPELTPEETAAGQGLGLTSYVANKQTGVITVHPSLHPWTIGEMFDQAIETGQPVQGRQVHPKRRRATYERLDEEARTITYQVTVSSLENPSTPPAIYRTTIDKTTFVRSPRGPMDSLVLAQAEQRSRLKGIWPASGIIED